MASPGYKGTNKYQGRSLGFFTFKGKTYCAWVRLAYTGQVESRANTNAASEIEQIQTLRQDTPTFEAEVMLPWGVTGASLVDFIGGSTGTLGFGSNTNVVFPNVDKFGPYIIERSSIELSRDNFTSVRMSLRGLGYTKNRSYSTAAVGADFDLWDPDFDLPANTQNQTQF